MPTVTLSHYHCGKVNQFTTLEELVYELIMGCSSQGIQDFAHKFGYDHQIVDFDILADHILCEIRKHKVETPAQLADLMRPPSKTKGKR